jgi:DNA-binding CsgD family transcriptional regulator
MRNDTRSEIVMQLFLHEKEESVWYAELPHCTSLQEFDLHDFTSASNLILSDCSPTFAVQCGSESARDLIGQAINGRLFGEQLREVVVLNDKGNLPHIVKFVSIYGCGGSIDKAYFNIVGLIATGLSLNGMLGRRRDITQKLKAKEEREALEDSLTTRELEIFLWLAKGRTVKQIASLGGMMEKTVYFHIENIERKMHTCGILDIVQKAYRLGFMDSTEFT